MITIETLFDEARQAYTDRGTAQAREREENERKTLEQNRKRLTDHLKRNLGLEVDPPTDQCTIGSVTLYMKQEPYPTSYNWHLHASIPCDEDGCEQPFISWQIQSLADLWAFLNGGHRSPHTHYLGEDAEVNSVTPPPPPTTAERLLDALHDFITEQIPYEG